jgi:hypothetical protein
MNQPQEDRRIRCEGMARLSAAIARRVANRARGFGSTRRRRQAIHCEFCGYWHVVTPLGVRRWPG